jgi:hypothetical protein
VVEEPDDPLERRVVPLEGPGVGAGLLPTRVLPDLGPRLAEDGEAVVAGVVHPDPDGKPLGRKSSALGDAK